ncbi:hypothetical protein [Nonomuraea sp. SYSU D8015]|uniref:hypothetical protein n=1 Tax=Nonomuraea sp. SYSU D8015 TaxID=2593644 RepID=UPI0016604140|nr:hypothetical protein [Nonomuraea sp. SYSU D8015]
MTTTMPATTIFQLGTNLRQPPRVFVGGPGGPGGPGGLGGSGGPLCCLLRERRGPSLTTVS